jgi:signal transduction histidine kinase/CheY-like chemotaxis protein
MEGQQGHYHMHKLFKLYRESQDISLILISVLFVMFVIKLLTVPYGALEQLVSIKWLNDFHITIMFGLFLGFSGGIFLIRAISNDHKNLQFLLDHLAIGIIRYDAKGRWKDANSTARLILPAGFFEKREFHHFHDFLNFLWERGVESHNTDILGFSNPDLKYFVQEVIHLDSDRIGHVRIQKSVLGDTHIMITDVTDLQDTIGFVTHLEQENASLTLGLNHISDGMFIAELQQGSWQIIFGNTSFFTMHDVRRFAEFEQLYPHPEGVNISHFLDQSSSFSYEAERKINKGGTSYFSIHFDVFDMQSTRRMIVFIRDVTQARQKEMQLRHSLKLEAIGRLAGGVAHDFNNILSIIQGYVRILQSDVTTPSARDSLERILQATRRGVGITSQLLTFGRHRIMTNQSVDLNKFILDSETFLNTLLTSRIHMSLLLRTTSAWVALNEEYLTQVLMNLVVNAKDAMPEGGNLFIELDRVNHHDQEYIKLVVQDTGHGIPADIQDSIYDPFFTTKDIGKGSGLGLAIVHGLVVQAGGELLCTSTPGKGTSFTILLPALSAPEHHPLLPQERNTQPILHRAHVILAEDEDDLRNLIACYLKDKGYDVIAVKDGYEALAYLEETTKKVDYLITDIVMPRMDGIKLATLVREVYPDIFILCMSGYPQSQDDSIKKILDDVPFVAKPVDPEVLLTILRDGYVQASSAYWM